eukprot:scaffold110399_cov38-Prasinocladus_malaysianus.AAC.1
MQRELSRDKAARRMCGDSQGRQRRHKCLHVVCCRVGRLDVQIQTPRIRQDCQARLPNSMQVSFLSKDHKLELHYTMALTGMFATINFIKNAVHEVSPRQSAPPVCHLQLFMLTDVDSSGTHLGCVVRHTQLSVGL